MTTKIDEASAGLNPREIISALDALWDAYDRALVSYDAYTAVTMDPDTLASQRWSLESALKALHEVGHEPDSAEDEAVRKAGLTHDGPGWLNQVRALRSLRTVTHFVRGDLLKATLTEGVTAVERCPTCATTHGLLVTRTAAILCPACDAFSLPSTWPRPRPAPSSTRSSGTRAPSPVR